MAAERSELDGPLTLDDFEELLLLFDRLSWWQHETSVAIWDDDAGTVEKALAHWCEAYGHGLSHTTQLFDGSQLLDCVTLNVANTRICIHRPLRRPGDERR